MTLRANKQAPLTVGKWPKTETCEVRMRIEHGGLHIREWFRDDDGWHGTSRGVVIKHCDLTDFVTKAKYSEGVCRTRGYLKAST